MGHMLIACGTGHAAGYKEEKKMKAVIWIGCFLAVALINAALMAGGIRLGAIPMVLLFAAASKIGAELCKKWDENHRQ